MELDFYFLKQTLGPYEFSGENSEADRYYDNGRPGQNNHGNADREDEKSGHGNYRLFCPFGAF